MWTLSVIASLGIAIPYFGVCYFVLRGLVKGEQLSRNPLALGTAMIFFSCGAGHLLHAEHMVFGDAAMRAAADLHITLWDASTAAVAIWYLSMRARYGQLLHPEMFEDQDRVVADAKVRRAADRDELTGLLNREALLRTVKVALDLHVSADARGLLFLDLDGFKTINDRFGHSAGDALLIAVVERLHHALRPEDTLARLGGDEFVIFLEGAITDAGAATVAERLRDALSAPFPIEDESILLTTSIGIALTGPGDLGAHQLMQQADLAMYDAKNEGPGRYSFATPSSVG